MAEVYEIILQYDATNALADAYTVPALTSHVISTINICNYSATPRWITIKIAKAGAGNADSQYIYASLIIAANDTFQTTAGITIEATDVVRVQAEVNSAISVNMFGTTIT